MVQFTSSAPSARGVPGYQVRQNRQGTVAQSDSAAVAASAASAAKWTTGRTITISGDAAGVSAAWDGSTNISFALTLANTAVTPAIYGDATRVAVVQFDAKGRAVAAANQAIAFPVPSVTFGTGAPAGTPAAGALYFDTTIAVFVGYVGRSGVWNQF